MLPYLLPVRLGCVVIFAWLLRTRKGSLEAALRTAKEASTAAAAAAAELRKELAARPAVSEVKALRQQLRVLQQLEFNANNDDDDEVSFVPPR